MLGVVARVSVDSTEDQSEEAEPRRPWLPCWIMGDGVECLEPAGWYEYGERGMASRATLDVVGIGNEVVSECCVD